MSNVIPFEAAIARHKQTQRTPSQPGDLIAFKGIDLQTVNEMLHCLELRDDQVRLNFFKARYAPLLAQYSDGADDQSVTG